MSTSRVSSLGASYNESMVAEPASGPSSGERSQAALSLLLFRLETQRASWERQLNRATTVVEFAIALAAAYAAIIALAGESPNALDIVGLLFVIAPAGLVVWVYSRVQKRGPMKTTPEPGTVTKQLDSETDPEALWRGSLVKAIEYNRLPLKKSAGDARHLVNLLVFQAAVFGVFAILSVTT